MKYVSQKNHGAFIGQIKYMQYREGKQEHIVQRTDDGTDVRRFIDRGLGDDYRTIHNACDERKTTTMQVADKNVTARLMMVGPEPQYMHAIPEDSRLDVLEEYTDAVVQAWFEKMETPGQPEYSFVMHEANTDRMKPQDERDELEHDKSYFHSHVIISPTTQNIDGPEQYYVGRKELEMLHEAGREQMERIWIREIGQDRLDELNQYMEDRTQQLIEHDRADTLELLNDLLPTTGPAGMDLSIPEPTLEDIQPDITDDLDRDEIDIVDDDDFGLELD